MAVDAVEQQPAGSWREYLRLYRGSLRDVALSVLGSAGQSLLLIPVALLVRHAFDRAVPAGDVAALGWIALGIVALHVASGAILLWSRAIALRVTKEMIGRLRGDLVLKIYALPRGTVLGADIGKTHAVIVHDTERVDGMSVALITQLLPSVAVASVLALLLVYLNWFLFLVVLAVLPVLMLVLRAIGQLVKPHVADFHEAFGRFSKGILFVIQRLDLTKSHAAEGYEVERQSASIRELGQVSGRMAWWQAAHNVSQETVTSASWALVLVAGGVAVAAGTMTIGDVLSFSVVALILKRAVNTMLNAVPVVVQGEASLAALQGLASLPEDPAHHGRRRIRFDGRVRLEAVKFRYGAEPLLERIDLETEPGRLTAITGPSGSGKTSLVYVILGFYRPMGGTISGTGVDYDELDLRDVRAGVGFVPQEALVFSGTVLENIAYGASEPDREHARAVARHAMAEEFIEALPDGYDTRLGEDGAFISGGQRQRIALARALYRRPRLLLLDEPTSHIDESLARRILESLRHLPERPAILVASHDDAVVSEADEVLELRRGRLVRRPVQGREAVA